MLWTREAQLSESTTNLDHCNDAYDESTVLYPVSIKHGLRTTDYGLRTGYKMLTKHYRLGIKYGLGYKTRTKHYGLSIKHEERFYIE